MEGVKGKLLEKIKLLGANQTVQNKLIKMRRSKWKIPFLKFNQVKNRNIVSRSSKILPKFLGLSCHVYNGQNYDEIIITKDMLGHKFGEFSFTRKKFSFKKKKRKK